MPVTRSDILDVLRSIPDPEMPISIHDLGLVEALELTPGPEGTEVSITMLPTFVGCPALDMIADDVRTKVGAVPGVSEVDVQFTFDPPWSVDRISAAGRDDLRAHGVTVPEQGSRLGVPGHQGGIVTLRTSAVPCPFCHSTSTRLDSPFGPTRCRMIYYCEACRNSFEHLKRV